MKQKVFPWSAGRGGIFAAVCLLFFGTQDSHSATEFEELTIVVPAGRNSGWDLTARAMEQALLANDSVSRVKIEYSPGAGGLIGMAQFISARQGQSDVLIVGGVFTLGAAVGNRATISLLDTSPVARLTIEHAVVAVPASSKIRSASDLIEAMLAAPESISWVGGSRAGVDEINMHEIARALGIPPSRMHYTGMPGGGDASEALVDGQFHVGISGYSEFESFVKEGKLRVIARINAEDKFASDATSFEQLGIRVERFNWRGVFSPPGLTAEQSAKVSRLIESMVNSDEWSNQLEKHHWQDAYLAGPAFVEFLRAEQERVIEDLAAIKEFSEADDSVVSSVLIRRYAWALALAGLSVLLVLGLFIQRMRAQRREQGLQHAFEDATGEAILRKEELERAFAGIHAQIEREFNRWGLTVAEREVGLLLLKGLRLKEIAEIRGTSERTVRQQALAVYKKAGLNGRSDLAAYFLEDFMQSMDTTTDSN